MEKAVAPHSSTLAWKIPWTEEPGRLGSLRVGHGWVTSLSLFTFMHWRRKWQPTQCSCLENPRDGGAWWEAVYGVTQSPTQLKWLSSSSSSNLDMKSSLATEGGQYSQESSLPAEWTEGKWTRALLSPETTRNIGGSQGSATSKSIHFMSALGVPGLVQSVLHSRSPWIFQASSWRVINVELPYTDL